MLQRRMLQSACADLPLAYEFLVALAYARCPGELLETMADEPLELGTDDVVLAARLAELLSPIASSLVELFASGSGVVIKASSYAEVLSLADLLECALEKAYLDEGARPTTRSEDHSHPLILATSPNGFMSPPDKALASAYRTNSFVLCLISPGFEDENSRTAVLAADIVAPLPTVTRAVIDRAFVAAFGEAPAALVELEGFEHLDTRKIGAIVRSNRPIAECVGALRGLMVVEEASQDDDPREELKVGLGLEDSFGYGAASEWAANLMTDYNLWRSGKIDWLEVADRALVLSGPPGTGKSTFPRLLAKSMGVPLIETSVAEWNSHKNLSGTLVQMREVFSSVPEAGCVIFIDELDGIGRRDRPDNEYRAYWDQIVNQLLTLVSEAIERPGVVLVGATNYPDRIDPALLRSGRIERHICLTLPDRAARAGILRQYVKVALSEDDLLHLAEMTWGHSGADLERIVRQAGAAARRRGSPMAFLDLVAEVTRPLDQLGHEDRQRTNVYQHGRKLVAELLETNTGEVPLYPTINQLRDLITILLSGRAAEEIMMARASTLGEADLAEARRMSEAIETRWALGAKGIGQADDPKQRSLLVEQHLEEALVRARELLSDNLEELTRRCAGEPKMVAEGRRALPTTIH